MFNRLIKFRKGDNYEEMEGEVKMKSSTETNENKGISQSGSVTSFPDGMYFYT